MNKHILTAVDLGHRDEALKLVKEASRLAGFDNAQIHLVTVLPDYGSSFVGSFFREGTLKEASAAALDALHALADEALAEGQEAQCIVEIGTVYEKTLKTAKRVEADLIVVGAHKPDLTDRVMGPNAARVSRYADVSVLVLRV